MAWIRVDQSLRHHRKVIALANELGIGAAAATGHLILLWLWCLDNAPTGILKGINGQQIATGSAWTDNPNDLVNALLSTGFIEKCGRGGISLRIHDWEDYGGKLLQSRARHREVVRQSRDRLDQTRSDQSRRDKSREEKKPPPPTPSGSPGAFEDDENDLEVLEQGLNELFPEGWKVKGCA